MSRRTAIILLIVLAASAEVGRRVYQAYHPPVRNYPKAVRTIVAFGDSITRGYGASRDKDYPSQLGAKLGLRIINAGHSGDETADGLARLEQDVLSHRPDLVLLCLGGNDMLARKDPQLVYDNLALIIDRLQESGAIVALIEIRHVIPLLGYGELYRRLAREKQCIFVPDALAGIVTRKKLMKDQLHPNNAGYKKFADKVYHRIKGYLNN